MLREKKKGKHRGGEVARGSGVALILIKAPEEQGRRGLSALPHAKGGPSTWLLQLSVCVTACRLRSPRPLKFPAVISILIIPVSSNCCEDQFNGQKALFYVKVPLKYLQVEYLRL